MILVSVFDKKSDEYAPCYCVNSIAVACRSFENTVKRGESDLSNFPEDFALIQVGEFINGIVKPIDPVVLANAIDYFPKKTQDKIHKKVNNNFKRN